MKRQRKSCWNDSSQPVFSTSGLSRGLSMITVCSPAKHQAILREFLNTAAQTHWHTQRLTYASKELHD